MTTTHVIMCEYDDYDHWLATVILIKRIAKISFNFRAQDINGNQIIFFLFFHEDMLWVLIRSASVR